MAAELPYDIIVHIIMQLPLKYATRCCILNKHLYGIISTPKFVRDHHALLSSSPPSSTNPILLHHSFTFNNPSAKFTTISTPLHKSTTLANEGMILLDSCNGILLLYGKQSANHYIFNPFTGGLMFLNYHIKRPQRWGLFVADPSTSSSSSSNSSSFDFKLVDLQTKKLGARGHTRLRFRVLVPSGQSELVTKESYLNYEGSFTRLIGECRRPVYGNGTLHWLGVGATAIAAFDVESGWARIMRGPVRDAIDCSYYNIWFGFAHGSLQFIMRGNGSEGIIVHSHNWLTQEWRVAHKIRMPDITGDGFPVPMFFDGMQKVYVHSMENDNNVEEIYVHDLSVGKWIKSGEFEVLGDYSSWRYVEFFPTMARVSDVYLSDMLAKRRSTKKGLCLLQLQRFLLDRDS